MHTYTYIHNSKYCHRRTIILLPLLLLLLLIKKQYSLPIILRFNFDQKFFDQPDLVYCTYYCNSPLVSLVSSLMFRLNLIAQLSLLFYRYVLIFATTKNLMKQREKTFLLAKVRIVLNPS